MKADDAAVMGPLGPEMTTAEQLGWQYFSEGAESLRAFMKYLVAFDPAEPGNRELLAAKGLEKLARRFMREDYLEAADELELTGIAKMREAAKIVRRYALKMPSKFDQPHNWSAPGENSSNDIAWAATQARRRKEWERQQAERQERLKAQKAKN